METLESLRRKIEGAEDIKSVVKTMKAVAASNIGEYETAVNSLGAYYRTIGLGVIAYFHAERIETIQKKLKQKSERTVCAIVFGTDQGLVGPFNDTLVNFATQSLKSIPGKKEIWAVGERIQLLLSDNGFNITKKFLVPSSVHAITPLVGEILINSQGNEYNKEVYVFHNKPKLGSGYLPVSWKLLPLDENWRQEFNEIHWPTKNLPQVAGDRKTILRALIREFLFISIFKACTESLASENASRLAAMQRAEKNIEEMLYILNKNYHHIRQNSIDEELFDVVSGFEALNNNIKNEKSRKNNIE